jgi:putative NADPH-quinone reductase
MKTLVVLAHPDFESSVVNKFFINHLPKNNPDFTVHQLYKEYPNYVFDVQAEQNLLEQHERLIFQFPFYWYSSPFLLQKYLEDVFLRHWCYGDNGTRLRGKQLGIATSTGRWQSAYQAGGKNHFTMSELLRPFQAAANYTQMTYLPAFVFHGARTATESDLNAALPAYLDFIFK